MTDHEKVVRADDRALDPVEAFSLLANETRMAVMDALWGAYKPLTFSEIMERAGISDTGNFNYHLGELRGHFVVKREDDRYQLTAAGRSAMVVAQRGKLTHKGTLNRTRIEYPCPYCGTDAAITYSRDEKVRLLCMACEGSFRGALPSTGGNNPQGTITVLRFPPTGIVGRTPTELAEAATSWTIPQMWTTLGGSCSHCGGKTERTIHVCRAHDTGDGLCSTCESRFGVTVEQRCQQCRYAWVVSGFFECLRENRVREWFMHRGYDLSLFRIGDWTRAFPVGDTILDTDPLAFEVSWTVDGETLVVRTDELLGVVDLDSSKSERL